VAGTAASSLASTAINDVDIAPPARNRSQVTQKLAGESRTVGSAQVFPLIAKQAFRPTRGTMATGKLRAFAIGRGLDHHDMAAIRTIARDAAASGDTWSSIVSGIVTSTPFRMAIAPGDPSEVGR